MLRNGVINMFGNSIFLMGYEVVMRDLTQIEIDQAPVWATHYCIEEDESILFESNDYYQYLGSQYKEDNYYYGIDFDSKPIPRR